MGLPITSKLLCALLAGFLFLVPGPTPESTISAFVGHVNLQDFSGAARLVQGGKPNENFKTIASLTKQLRFSLGQMKTVNNGHRAEVTVEVTLSDGSRPPQKATEKIDLVKVNNEWLIVPPGDDDIGKRGMLSSMAAMTTNPSMVFTNAKSAAKKASCLSNLKQLALAATMFTLDNNDVYKLNPSKVQAALHPYLKNDQLWYCPSGAKGTPAYSFNAKLIGKKTAEIKDPSKTIMLYEGSKGKLDFRHNGSAAVAFADGHVKSYKPADAAKLLWNP